MRQLCCLILGVFWCAGALAQGGKEIQFKIRPGQWRLSSKVDGSSMGIKPMAPADVTHCIQRRDTAASTLVSPPSAGCTTDVTRAAPEVYRWITRCPYGDARVNHVGQLAFLTDQVVGSITVTMPQMSSDGSIAPNAPPVSMIISLQGRYVGECK